MKFINDSACFLLEKLKKTRYFHQNQNILQNSVDLWTQKQKPPWVVDVEADEEVKYGAIVPVVARLKELGIDMNLVIQPKAK